MSQVGENPENFVCAGITVRLPGSSTGRSVTPVTVRMARASPASMTGAPTASATHATASSAGPACGWRDSLAAAACLVRGMPRNGMP